jgi:hypothetical protein
MFSLAPLDTPHKELCARGVFRAVPNLLFLAYVASQQQRAPSGSTGAAAAAGAAPPASERPSEQSANLIAVAAGAGRPRKCSRVGRTLEDFRSAARVWQRLGSRVWIKSSGKTFFRSSACILPRSDSTLYSYLMVVPVGPINTRSRSTMAVQLYEYSLQVVQLAYCTADMLPD